MAGKKTFARLRDGMTPEARMRIQQKTAGLRAEINLGELRRAYKRSGPTEAS